MSEANRTVEVEEWRDIAGFEGAYQVSNLGRVKSLSRTVELMRHGKPTVLRVREKIRRLVGAGTCGHVSVGLYFGNKRAYVYVHRLVLEAFVGPCPDGMEACHFPDRDPSNNRLSNLRWDTHEQNFADAVKHGTHIGRPHTEETRKKLRAAWRRRKIKWPNGFSRKT